CTSRAHVRRHPIPLILPLRVSLSLSLSLLTLTVYWFALSATCSLDRWQSCGRSHALGNPVPWRHVRFLVGALRRAASLDESTGRRSRLSFSSDAVKRCCRIYTQFLWCPAVYSVDSLPGTFCLPGGSGNIK
ncbi:unnamed protein product, partial [Scytosiphon promiscuus]